MSSYFDESKADNESLIFCGRISYWVIAWFAAKGMGLLATLFWLKYIDLNPFEIHVDLLGGIELTLFSIVYAISLVWYTLESARVLIYVLASEILVSNRRFIFKTGLIFRDTQEIRVGRIEGSSVSQSILQRILRIGNLRVQGTGGDLIVIHNIKSPVAGKKAVLSASMDE